MNVSHPLLCLIFSCEPLKKENTNKTPENVVAAHIQSSYSYSLLHRASCSSSIAHSQGSAGAGGWTDGDGFVRAWNASGSAGAGLAWSALSWLLQKPHLLGRKGKERVIVILILQCEGQREAVLVIFPDLLPKDLWYLTECDSLVPPASSDPSLEAALKSHSPAALPVGLC